METRAGAETGSTGQSGIPIECSRASCGTERNRSGMDLVPGVVPVTEGMAVTVATTAVLGVELSSIRCIDIPGRRHTRGSETRAGAKAGLTVKAAYQLSVPALAVAPSVTVPGPHLVPGVVPVTVGMAVTIATTAVLGVELHPTSVAST